MKIAILGGGFTGLTAAYYLAKKGHKVTIFEKEKVLGGLAVGFKSKGWDWYLERAYHHLLDSEDDILNFAKEIDFEEIFFKNTSTASLYETGPQHPSQSDYRIFPVDSPQDFLKLPLLSLPEKLRAGAVIAFLKTSPFLSFYEKQTARQFLEKTMGKRVWEVLWQELFRKKFGKYAENILATFIWARIKKRAKQLGYIKGGFQTFIDYVEEKVKGKGVSVKKEYTVLNITKKRGAFEVLFLPSSHPEFISGSDSKRQMLNQVQHDIHEKEEYDVVISTLPTVIMGKITKDIFSPSYLDRFTRLAYLHAVVLILETKEPILKDTYWLNICTPKIPIMLVAQHTNFIDKKYYGGNNLSYFAWYVDRDNPLLKMTPKQVFNYALPYIKKVTSYELQVVNYYHFIGPFAQPIFDKDFVKNKPDFITPVKNFFIANLDMTYPYDRGTNYAVKLGKEVSEFI
ncbi:hypothetical protein A2866_03845 [Candidatus Roizmanbacteria bacterium RIFCSPHIGHO2_01_FULL_39_8]|uniref:Amine oxidase domain-containing protein n=1 Tax=Candidatus Roizmanbacteria bacterium RIFCSPHIGHO2_01_FULL_39_8 TaxID=1802033 RepID=A0A1F7GRL4_9BACT|nr:MAG: hypothetical protein A2866_03845 [Candidatus Roizmanbacteria bacterium RIFCSPHIGHO2_01_FULL_39_8]